ncbi:MAG TPA: TIGR00282 family metallophosphoesterase [Deltaproteobacteria bacterium]|nr:TIGR00282 family metallophosphoesterase [Deltaproteobacteria bacterium]
MKILFIGDIVGRPGRRAINEFVPSLIAEKKIDMVIANCENSAAGFGVTKEIVDELFGNRIDILTSGNHIWNKKEALEFINEYETLLRPANYPATAPGTGAVVFSAGSSEYVAVLNLAGRIFMQPAECPFVTAKKEISALKQKTKIIIVDFHAEATSEKKAMGWYLDGEVSAVLGTHTHVQTADEEILPQGTAYISDAGMTGPFDSVIGVKKETIIERFLTNVPNKFDVAKGDIRLQGVLLDIDAQSGRANSIDRISVKVDA